MEKKKNKPFVLSVKCPRCLAEPGKMCRDLGMVTYSHQLRIKEAEMAGKRREHG